MRVMNIPLFPERFECRDLETLFKPRLSQSIVRFPKQAIPLVCYMACPNDVAARDEAFRTLKSWPEGSEDVPRRLSRIQHEWSLVADIFHLFCDLIDGQHQQRRGGPSIERRSH